MNHNIKALLAAALLTLSACTGNYIDINSNPYEPNADQMKGDGYIIGTAMSNLASTVISTDVNTAQFTECLLGGPLAGYFADSNAGWTRTISCFNASDGWTNVLLASDQCVPKVYSNLAELRRNTDDPVVLAIAQVIKVAAMHRVTDTYGPIPYSKISVGGELQVAYDSQEQVYDAMFQELDDAIATLTEARTTFIPATTDYIYSGSVEKWAKFANSLKLRLAMRIVYADKAKAQQKAEEAVSSAVGVMTSNADNAQLTNFGEKGNPLYTAVNYNRASGCQTGGDAHAAADIITYMNGYKDPRRAAYFTVSEWDNTDDNDFTYVGLRHGIEIPANNITRKYSGVNVTSATPLVWMNAAEVYFLRAEAAAVFGFNMGASAKDLYEQGVRASFEQWGVNGADAYLADNTSLPGTYTDPYNGVNTYNETLTTLPVAWDESATAEQKQERIITQKWIAMWLTGCEAWADYRRTGFPHIFPATARGNKSLGLVDSSLGARRMPYPTNEYTTNNDNVQAAVSSLLRGADNMGTRLWWDCNPAVR